MARIRSLDKKVLQRNSVHSPADATYSEFVGDDGMKYFQIDTYGSDSREMKGKRSQSIQMNRKTAVELIERLKEAFQLK